MKTKVLILSCLLVALLASPFATAQLGGAAGPTQEIGWQSGPDTAPSGDRPPNIVLILADDLGWNDLTFNGGGVAGGTVPTPHIDSIAKQGANFRNGYSASGTCAPSRAAILSGRYPTRFGFEFTPTPPQMIPMLASSMERAQQKPPAISYVGQKEPVPFPRMGMPTEEISLAETLKGAGYYTAHIGKWHVGHANGMNPNAQGFDDSLLMDGGLYLPEDHPNVVNSKQDFDPIDRFLWRFMQFGASFNGGPRFEPPNYLTDYYTDEAVKLIEQNKNRPFFLYLAHWAPHTPLQATKADYDALSHIDNHTERTYAAMIRALDRGVGQVLDALKENGLEENTVVMFTSDNGGAGYLGLPEVNEPFRGWKITYFEGGIHVPYFIKWPGKIKPGTTFDRPVHHFDLFTTAAAAAGAKIPTDRPMDGANLLPYITADAASIDAPPHEKLFWRGGHYQVVLANGYKMHRADRPDKVWLFNMDDDPTEQNNIADENPDLVTMMSAMIDEHNTQQIDPSWPALLESPIFIDKTVDQPHTELDDHVYWPN